MRNETTKQELINWLTSLNDDETIEYLKIVKDSKEVNKDWWVHSNNEVKKGIQRGLKDIELGKTVSHSVVKEKYGL